MKMFTHAAIALLLTAGLAASAHAEPRMNAEIQAVSLSADDAVVTIEGRLIDLKAIGGETTGYGLETSDGNTVELDLDTHHFADLFSEGATVEVTGSWETVRGVEIASRQVLVVTDFARATDKYARMQPAGVLRLPTLPVACEKLSGEACEANSACVVVPGEPCDPIPGGPACQPHPPSCVNAAL